MLSKPIAVIGEYKKYRHHDKQNECLVDVIRKGCGCSKQCLLNLCESQFNYSRGVKILHRCRSEVSTLNLKELHENMTLKFMALEKEKLQVNTLYEYSVNHDGKKYVMCLNAFMLCYGITKYAVLKAKSAVEANVSGVQAFTDRTKVSVETIDDLDVCLQEAEISRPDRRDIIGLCRLPNTSKSLEMHSWMSFHFQLVGDQMPNTYGEIHLEPQDKLKIYQEYVAEHHDDHLSYISFLKMWDDCFEHVKIREYKQVTGKCMDCFKLSEIRKNRKDIVGRQAATLLHAFHKSMYMNEKTAYYARNRQALNDPANFVSIISDGMAQNHTKLPWLANIKEFPVNVTQHLQGIIDHGHEFVIYRSFHNVSIDSNLAIHCLLLQLEQRMVNGKLPSTVYIQIDGGSENANQYTLAMCELLIIRRLCKKVILTRLPVGHTHENIDGKFALIWIEARNSPVLTPMKYLDLIIAACSKKGQSVRVVDIFVVPDYKGFFDGFIDDELSNYAKGDDTQLQFIFEAVPISNLFPYGAKVTYRAFSCDSVYEIKENPDANCVGFEPVKTIVSEYPQGGTWFLRGVPNRRLYPAKFVSGSRVALDKFFSKFKDEFEDSQRWAVTEWMNFMENCPASDDSSVFASSLEIPFKDTLFSADFIVPVNSEHSEVAQSSSSTEMFMGSPIRTFISTASVRHHNRGDTIPPRPAPRMEIGGSAPVAVIPNIEKMKLKELRALLRRKGQLVSGNKAELLARLRGLN